MSEETMNSFETWKEQYIKENDLDEISTVDWGPAYKAGMLRASEIVKQCVITKRFDILSQIIKKEAESIK